MSYILDDTFNFQYALKVFPTEGNLVYEYNPFFNYRIDETMIYYKSRLWTLGDFADEFGVDDIYYYDDGSIQYLTGDELIETEAEELEITDYTADISIDDDGNVTITYTYEIDEVETVTEISSSYRNVKYDFINGTLTIEGWNEDPFNVPSAETAPVVYQAGQLVDFDTDELTFSLNNPVNLTAQWSYDNSVNLVINDGLNPPRLINSRFSPTERHQYQVCNRKVDNDTNIYDKGDQFDIDTSLYKKMTTIPTLDLNSIGYGGNLAIGNYFFYFKYQDDDGNESDFFAESGLVSIFIGNTPDSIYSGFRDENSHKQVKFTLSNTDSGYQKITVYYTRSSGDIDQNATLNAYKILQDYYLAESGSTIIIITGYEKTVEVSTTDINAQYQIYGAAETQAACANMLFLGNLSKIEMPYDDLTDCALRFLPYITTETYDYSQIGDDYSGSADNTYYDPTFIYKKTGYWDDEMYRLGIVFIMQDLTLSDVYNTRGLWGVSTETTTDNYTNINFYTEDGTRNYINYDPQSFVIISEDNNTSSSEGLENSKGVIQINQPDPAKVIGINFYVQWQVINYLRDELKVKGFFFVRQKRIPTTLTQAYIISIDNHSYTPVIPQGEDEFVTESFLATDTRYLEHDITNRLRTIEKYQTSATAAICPEYDIDSAYLNQLFTGSEFKVRTCLNTNYLGRSGRQWTPSSYEFQKGEGYTTVKIVGIEDDVKLASIGSKMFRGRAGEAEEGFRFEYLGKENIIEDVEDLLRGSYGPFLGITGYEHPGHLVDIKIPGYSSGNMSNYFYIRYNDRSPFYAISSRIDITQPTNVFLKTDGSSVATYVAYPDIYAESYVKMYSDIYRGDCYICQFTHRFNRNFQDPSAPTNDDIVDRKCWVDNFEVEDEVVKTDAFEDINLGDLNAIMEGMWITLMVRSTYNLNVRAIDKSNADETALTGHYRAFYPYYPMSGAGSYKIPEALCINKGFQASVSARENYELPDVPWIKNEFSNRIAYSNIQVQDAFQNGWRTFMGQNYRDYPKTWGSITKLVEFGGNLICVCEHGIILIPVNERALVGEGAGGSVFVNTSNVLPETPNPLSKIYGSQWRESVIATEKAVYGVDTISKVIWRTNGSIFEIISDGKVQEFLQNNISLTEREMTPIIGVRNVKTHYNAFKQDILFTFYDNLYGFEEKVWNLCYNETQGTFITFYSWVPSYSENIYNQFFTFDRNTSKWIAKLGVSHANNDFSDGVTLSDNIIYDSVDDDGNNTYKAQLSLSNRTLPEGDGVTVTVTYTLERDNYGNYKYFEIIDGTDDDGNAAQFLTLKEGVSYANLCSEFYYRIYQDDDGNTYNITPDDENYDLTLSIASSDTGKRLWLDQEDQKNSGTLVRLLNIRANITTTYSGSATLADAYLSGSANLTEVDAGYYESVVTVIPYYNMQFLTTDFWKHGYGGIIDIADKIYPAYWYGKQHPFEIEFVVNGDIDKHKIFDNLKIISNSAEPESFHYEIIGDSYDWAKDKKNMYIRQEATEELYQYNGMDVVFDHEYEDLESEQRAIDVYDQKGNQIYDKSTLLPLYYSRQDTINEIEDYYHLKDNVNTKDFSARSGGEIVYYPKLDEYRVWNHCKAVNMATDGRLRGNMHYKEDIWYVQINPLNLVQCNEPKWRYIDENGLAHPTDKVPVELNQSPIPDEIYTKGSIEIPDTDSWSERGYVTWDYDDSKVIENKIKDKWLKIRIRYTGDKLAIISAITVMYSITSS